MGKVSQTKAWASRPSLHAGRVRSLDALAPTPLVEAPPGLGASQLLNIGEKLEDNMRQRVTAPKKQACQALSKRADFLNSLEYKKTGL